MYELAIKPNLRKKLGKLARKNKKQAKLVLKKAQEILKNNPDHYKNLRKPLQKWKRVHVDKHFVLTFSIDQKNKIITLEDYDHHDIIYQTKP